MYQVELAVEEPIELHKIVKKCVILMLHKSKSIHARAVKLHRNKD